MIWFRRSGGCFLKLLLDRPDCILHQRVADTARNLGTALRKENVAAPPVLRDVVDALSDDDALPRDFQLARARAAKRVADLEKKDAIDRDYRLLEAARKGPGSLSEKDQRLLDDEKADFQRELDEEHDETK